MTVRQSKMFVIAFVASTALLAAAGWTAIYDRANEPICQCGGG